MATTERKKLLFYVPSLGDGGGERLWAALATQFHQMGFNVHFAQDFEGIDNRHVLDPNIPLHTLNTSSGRGHAASICALANLLGDVKPDVALSAIAGSNLKLIFARILARSNTRIIQTFHGHNEWQTGWLSYITYRLLPITSRIADHTVAVSEPLRLALIKNWKSSAHRTSVVINPVQLPNRIKSMTPQDLIARPPVVLSVGRLSSDKDFGTLLGAFAKLQTSNARLIIAGKGPEQEKLEAMAHALGIVDRVDFPGYVKDPWPYYEQAKCFALSSTSESFGNVVVEALAHGLPVVATKTDGPLHILTSDQLGSLVDVGDENGMARAIDAALLTPGDPVPRQHRAADFSMSAGLQSYARLIADVVPKSSADRPISHHINTSRTR